MSHLDPYGGAEPRGWDRPDGPVALPWPEPAIDPGPWARHPDAAAELYAEPQVRSRPPADPYADRGGAYPPDPYADRGAPYPPAPHDDGYPTPPYDDGYPPVPHDDGYPTAPHPERNGAGRRGERDPYQERRRGPYRDGGPRHDDPRHDRPRREGPYDDGPYREGPYDDGPYHDGPRRRGHDDPERYGEDRRPGAYGDEPYRERRDDHGERYPDEHGAGRYDLPPPSGAGRHDMAPASAPGRYDDDTATAQLAPVRDDLAPVRDDLAPVRDDLGPEPEPEPPRRRRPGKRRASADRPATHQTPSRAGRNLPAAIGVGVALGAVILLALFVYPPAFLAVIVAAVGVAVWELGRAVRRSGAHPPLVPLIAGGALTVGLAWFAGPDALSLGLIVTVLGTMIWRLGDGPGGYQRDLTAATLIAVYVPFLGGFAALLAAAPDDGSWRILATLVAVVLSDTGGYVAGVLFGKHPMAPSVSPKKSWEGFAGSVTAAALGSALLIWLVFDVAPWWGAVFGLAVSCAAVLGDLAESMIKRDLGVKDMSNLLPGHGGLMDRLDSILFAVPTAYLLLAVFVPVAGG